MEQNEQPKQPAPENKESTPAPKSWANFTEERVKQAEEQERIMRNEDPHNEEEREKSYAETRKAVLNIRTALKGDVPDAATMRKLINTLTDTYAAYQGHREEYGGGYALKFHNEINRKLDALEKAKGVSIPYRVEVDADGKSIVVVDLPEEKAPESKMPEKPVRAKESANAQERPKEAATPAPAETKEQAAFARLAETRATAYDAMGKAMLEQTGFRDIRGKMQAFLGVAQEEVRALEDHLRKEASAPKELKDRLLLLQTALRDLGRVSRGDDLQLQAYVRRNQPEGVRPSLSKESQAALFTAALADTERQIANVESREESMIKMNEKAQKERGWFGALKTWATHSDPYAIELMKARHKLFSMKHMRRFVEEAKNETDPAKKSARINDARLFLGLRLLKENGELNYDKGYAVQGEEVDRDNSHFALEQEAIDVTRDALVDVGVTAATLGGGAVVNLGRKGAQVAAQQLARQGLKQVVVKGGIEGAKTGAAFGGLSSTVKNIDEVANKGRGIGEAAEDVAVETVKGGVLGGGLGVALPAAGRGLGKLKDAYGGKVADAARSATKATGEALQGAAERARSAMGRLPEGTRNALGKASERAQSAWSGLREGAGQAMDSVSQSAARWRTKASETVKGFRERFARRGAPKGSPAAPAEEAAATQAPKQSSQPMPERYDPRAPENRQVVDIGGKKGEKFVLASDLPRMVSEGEVSVKDAIRAVKQTQQYLERGVDDAELAYLRKMQGELEGLQRAAKAAQPGWQERAANAWGSFRERFARRGATAETSVPVEAEAAAHAPRMAPQSAPAAVPVEPLSVIPVEHYEFMDPVTMQRLVQGVREGKIPADEAMAAMREQLTDVWQRLRPRPTSDRFKMLKDAYWEIHDMPPVPSTPVPVPQSASENGLRDAVLGPPVSPTKLPLRKGPQPPEPPPVRPPLRKPDPLRDAGFFPEQAPAAKSAAKSAPPEKQPSPTKQPSAPKEASPRFSLKPHPRVLEERVSFLTESGAKREMSVAELMDELAANKIDRETAEHVLQSLLLAVDDPKTARRVAELVSTVRTAGFPADVTQALEALQSGTLEPEAVIQRIESALAQVRKTASPEALAVERDLMGLRSWMQRLAGPKNTGRLDWYRQRGLNAEDAIATDRHTTVMRRWWMANAVLGGAAAKLLYDLWKREDAEEQPKEEEEAEPPSTEELESASS